ncbi:hypothetical protein GUJ93_ZPchr0419g2956 [Zizania palustris]|uniref:Uncharacterized protein n=1 Tax=Zizania palustris TaxID=103762 RepID=A0A8J5RK20_ZIZPA|nr:hypothetical protein GUJ93_ZPchr0419g2956 [Zizania palustris]
MRGGGWSARLHGNEDNRGGWAQCERWRQGVRTIGAAKRHGNRDDNIGWSIGHHTDKDMWPRLTLSVIN